MKTYIYILKHPETFEVKYVGKTTNTKRRFAQHKSKKCLEKTASKKLAAWLLKLLSNNLIPIMEVIEECNEDWAERERYWISYYRETNINLCNLSDGGDGGMGHNEVIKNKIRNALLGRKRTQEERDAISNAMKGKKRPNSGKAISEAHRKRYLDKEERMKHGVKLRKKVTQYDLNNNFIAEFVSAREASRQLNIDCSQITNAIKNKRVFKDSYWSYEEAININEYRNHRGDSVSVFQYDLAGKLLKKWDCITKASKETSTSKSSIIRCCKQKQKTANNFLWNYEEAEDACINKLIEIVKNETNNI